MHCLYLLYKHMIFDFSYLFFDSSTRHPYHAILTCGDLFMRLSRLIFLISEIVEPSYATPLLMNHRLGSLLLSNRDRTVLLIFRSVRRPHVGFIEPSATSL